MRRRSRRYDSSIAKRRKILRYALVTLSVGLMINVLFGESGLGRRLLQEVRRPVMYTFYNDILGVETPAGMTYDAHDRLVRFWQQAWKRAGWEPRVLTLKDAMEHPRYEKFNNLLQRTGASEYDRLCFMRWLAMANRGGGWMSDYDVLPLHDFREEGFYLPNDGVLTVHNRQCPSLVSGAKSEWERVAKRIIEYAAEHHIDTDQKVLAALSRQKPYLFLMDLSVTQHMLNTTRWDRHECGAITPHSMRAVHFAHAPIKRAIREGKLPYNVTVQHRPEIVANWMQMWLEKCGEPGLFQRNPLLLKRTLRQVRAKMTETKKLPQRRPPEAPLNNTWVSGGAFQGYASFV